MSRDQFLDSVFNTMVNYLERQCLDNGHSTVQMSVSELSDKEIDGLVWENEEEYGMKISDIEIKECFVDAFNYIDSVYHITDVEHGMEQCM